tara:strand:+ start:1820 stop:2956 length:1137 start_codon:yes stop_codon:yes gene_type:complete
MNIIIAPDSFKESLDAKDVSTAIKKGVNKIYPQSKIQLVPISDGGEGALDIIVNSKLGKYIYSKSFDPLMRKINSKYVLFNDKKTAWIELSKSSGISLLKNSEKNPKLTTTYGTGILIKNAIERGCDKIIIGLGGSATNDGGTGILSALGFKFFDDKKNLLENGGGYLKQLKKIENTNKLDLKKIKFELACDVENKLLGKNGASHLYSPQKGARNLVDINILEDGLKNLSKIIKQKYKVDVSKVIGGGAAGGCGAGLHGILNATISSGFSLLSKIVELEKKIKYSDLVITGEGKIDSQSFYGKVPFQVAKIANKYKIPVICLSGSIDKKLKKFDDIGFSGLFSIQNEPISLKKSITKSKFLIENSTERILSFYKSVTK